MGRKRTDNAKQGFERAFAGRERTQGLLEIAGSTLSIDEVVEHMREAQAHGEPAGAVIPALFEAEPHFPDPSLARELFQSLLGLWDLVESGQPVPQEKSARPPRVRKPKPVPPGLFPPEGPDDAWVEHAWRYIEEVEGQSFDRLEHAFENKQDALLTQLDESGLTDDGYAVVRHLLFELHAMLELGSPKGLRSVSPSELKDDRIDARTPPVALVAYADEALFEAEQDEQAPLSPVEAAKVRTWAKRGLYALWSARKE